MSLKVGINGLGRIGRLLLRTIIDNPNFELAAINGSTNSETHAHLLKYDSVHGKANFDVEAEEHALIINGKSIKLTRERDPSNINWGELDIVFECTGQFNKRELAAKHLESGAKKVIVSAPCSEADATIVMGVNEEQLDKSHKVISVGSCTTNALAPIAKVLNDNIGIEQGHATTIHAYTGDQSLVDRNHKDLRRARAGAISMIPTSTGAAKALKLVIPELDGKISGAAVRVPTANVSLIDMSFSAKRETSPEEINDIMKKASAAQPKILGFAPAPLVSCDFVHMPQSSIFDPYETKVTQGKFVRVVSWYDNEWAFALRMLDVACIVTG